MTRDQVLAAGLAVLLGVGAGAVVTSLVVGTSPEPARTVAVPVDGWSGAAAVAGVPLRAPANQEEPDEIVAWGVVGDWTRPIEARWSAGLRVLQARVDLLPPDDGIGELVRVGGADDAWWHEELDNRYLTVVHGGTITLLSGIPDADLRAAAEAMAPVQP